MSEVVVSVLTVITAIIIISEDKRDWHLALLALVAWLPIVAGALAYAYLEKRKTGYVYTIYKGDKLVHTSVNKLHHKKTLALLRKRDKGLTTRVERNVHEISPDC